MAIAQHLEILKSGVEAWNRWRSENPAVRPDLSDADISHFTVNGVRPADLRGANLREVSLDYSYLKGSDLREADLEGASFEHANLSEAYLEGVCLCHANLKRANLHKARCGGTQFHHADLSGASLVETDVEGTVFQSCRVYGISAWDLVGDPASQQNLIITPPEQPVVEVDDLSLAQFVFLLLNHANLRRVIDSVAERGVLLLGRFGGGGIELLRAVAERLRQEDYLPMIFDFERPRDRDYTETVQTLAGLSRFIVVDLSGPSVPHELMATVPHYEVPVVPILEKGRRPHSMFVDLHKYPWVVRKITFFSSVHELENLISSEIVARAEEKVKDKKTRLSAYQ
jgi:uncharacterized protein YjbI with pentapeptide repeats